MCSMGGGSARSSAAISEFSLNFGGRVSTLIWERLPNTVYLGLVAFLFSTALGVSFGVLSALRPGPLSTIP